jgi:hypothetical protein
MPLSAVLGGLSDLSDLSGQYVAQAIDTLSPATPSWPPPGARTNPPRGTFSSALYARMRVLDDC